MMSLEKPYTYVGQLRNRVANFLQSISGVIEVRPDYGHYFCKDCGEKVSNLLDSLYGLNGKCDVCASNLSEQEKRIFRDRRES